MTRVYIKFYLSANIERYCAISTSINPSHQFLHSNQNKDTRLMTGNYKSYRRKDRAHRVRKNVYGAFPYPNLAQRNVTRTLCDIGGTLDKNKEPVTSNRATRELVWRGHRHHVSRIEPSSILSIVKGYRPIFYSWRLTSHDVRFSVTKIFLNSQAIHFTKVFDYIHLEGCACIS